MASGMDIPSFKFLDRLGCPVLKIGSGDTNNLELLEEVAKLGKPVILSTGMSTLDTVAKSVNRVLQYNEKVCLLQCTSSYPLPADEINLNVMDTYRENFGHRVIVGYSGHETGVEITLAAVAKGAKIVERHFTLNNRWKGTDHAASLEPSELKALCEGIRRIEKSLGSSKKTIQPSEKACKDKLGKSIVTTRFIRKGEKLTKDDITVKVSIPKGIDPVEMDGLIGKEAKNNINNDYPITDKDV